jgi:hypothetical protein
MEMEMEMRLKKKRGRGGDPEKDGGERTGQRDLEGC